MVATGEHDKPGAVEAGNGRREATSLTGTPPSLVEQKTEDAVKEAANGTSQDEGSAKMPGIVQTETLTVPVEANKVDQSSPVVDDEDWGDKPDDDDDWGDGPGIDVEDLLDTSFKHLDGVRGATTLDDAKQAANLLKRCLLRLAEALGVDA